MTDDLKGPLRRALARGARRKCPQCGEGSLFDRYLKPTTGCSSCGSGYDHIRTDDFAPWLTIIVLGHIFVPLVYHFDVAFHPPLWLMMSGVILTMISLILATLPNFKGICIALMWHKDLTGGEEQTHPSTFDY